jgi:hypothetical protein
MTCLGGSEYFHQLTFAFSEEWLLPIFQNKMVKIMKSSQSVLCVLLLSNFVISGAYFPADSDNITAQWMENYIQSGILPQVFYFLFAMTYYNQNHPLCVFGTKSQINIFE